MTGPILDDAQSALRQRLVAAHEALSGSETDPSTTSTAAPFDLLRYVLSLVADRADDESAWLLVVAMTGAYPRAELVQAVRRSVALRDPEDAILWLLDAVRTLALESGNASAHMRVVQGPILVDVTHTARSNFLTGIQRVVRAVAADWTHRHEVELIAWNWRGGAYRSLSHAERKRLLDPEVEAFDPRPTTRIDETSEIVVPWATRVLLTEVPAADLSERLASLAQLTSSTIGLVGYDCIPISSPETVPLDEPEKFGRYLELVKYADRVACISHAAAAEFQGFADAMATQGLAGPRVVACVLPNTTPIVASTTTAPAPYPVVACIGTVGRRKNQVALVEAAETLWREGLSFELRLLGHLGSERTPLAYLLPELRQAGRMLTVESGVSDERISQTLDEARCLVFPSLHEGFGLPVVEALSHALPVITSDFGSLREVAEGQGGLVVDPEDVAALTDALRALLTDDQLHARLSDQARNRSVRTWADYAVDLWEALA